MGKAIMGCAAVSADGYIADDDGQIGSLFNWMTVGDVDWKMSESDEYAMHTTRASKDFMQSVYTDIGAVIMGRNLFDQTNGWNGVPAAGDHVFVVTHQPPTDWEHADTAPFTFVTDVESAIKRAREYCGDRIVDVAAGQIGGQALRLGLIDQIVMNVVPTVFGGGRPFFGAMEAGEEVTLGNPSRVAQGNRVTHLLYDVER